MAATGQPARRDGPAHARLTVVLGHGASGNASSMAPWVDGLARRGIDARAIDLPRRRAEDAVLVFAAELERAGVLPGGHSFGGRVASLAAAGRIEHGGAVPGLVLLSYPLHRPGDPSGWVGRTAHWPLLRCPVLLLSGEADPFARIALLREAVGLLPNAELATFPRVGHGLLAVREAALDRIVAFVRSFEGG